MTNEIPEDLRFDHDELEAYDAAETQRFLNEEPDLYLNHLRIAAQLTGWAERVRLEVPEDKSHEDYANALDDVAAHLRLGHYLTDGTMFTP